MRKMKKVEKTIHQDIFYPSNENEIKNMIENCEKKYKANSKTDSKLFILPHASYEFILPLLINTFTSIKNDFDKVVIIAPSHLGIIDQSSPYNLFIPSYDAINTPLGILDLDKNIIEDHFKEDMKNDTYFEEESSFEQLYLLIKHYFGNKTVVPICAIIENSKQSKDFASILNTFVDDKTLVLLSANASSYQNSSLSYTKTKNFIAALENDERLLQLQRKNIIDSCGCGIIDSIIKTKKYKNKSWNVNLIEVESEISTSITKVNNVKKCVYHLSATIKDN
jgi:AmmeMemoRadiSam system protein B